VETARKKTTPQKATFRTFFSLDRLDGEGIEERQTNRIAIRMIPMINSA